MYHPSYTLVTYLLIQFGSLSHFCFVGSNYVLQVLPFFLIYFYYLVSGPKFDFVFIVGWCFFLEVWLLFGVKNAMSVGGW